MKAAIYTLGCKVNTYESEFLISELLKNNFEIVDFDDEADVYIINTCSVTNQSDAKSRKIIKRAKRKGGIVVALGCYVQSSIDNLIPEIDIALDNSFKKELVSLIRDYQKDPRRIIKTKKAISSEFEDMYLEDFQTRTRAFLKIQDGCDNFCSYCIIPFLRGKPRSKDPDMVIKEAKALVSKGFKEIVLTGIHTGHYGLDIDITFPELLRRLEKIEGLERIRISSVEITELNDDFLEVFKNSKKIVNHLHIPLQTGCDKILKIMNRKYDTKYYEDKIKVLRSLKEGLAVTTDVIVGHPYENDEDFKETLAFVEKIGFAKVHVFPYSKRQYTKSSRMPEVNGLIKKARCHELINLSKKLEIKYMQKFIGQEVEFLIEQNKDGYSYGHSTNYLDLKIAGNYEEGAIIKKKIETIKYPYVC